MDINVKRKNGVFQGFSIKRDPKKPASKRGSYTPTSSNTGYGVNSEENMRVSKGAGKRAIAALPKPSDYEAKRKNGVFQGIQTTKEGKARQEAARRRTATRATTTSRPKTASDRYAESLEENSPKYKTRAKIDARDPDKQNNENVDKMRKRRIASGDFKGKHYGPDEFKGNLAVLKAWRRAGSPKDTAGFNKNYKTTQKRYEARANRAG